MLHVGFSGSREGMTMNQMVQVIHLLKKLSRDGIIEVHHGDCVGSDSEFHEIASRLNLRIHIHPPENSSLRAFCKPVPSDNIEYVRPYLTRNKNIVKSCGIIICCPRKSSRGTWHTHNFALQCKKKVYLFKE